MSLAQEKGGYWALLGFFYQFLGTAGLTALRTRQVEEGSDPLIRAIADFNSDRNSLFRVEYGGQDLAIEKGKHVILAQFKASEDPTEKPVNLEATEDILYSFASSVLSLPNQVTRKDVTGCILVTNKPAGKAWDFLNTQAARCRSELKADPKSLQQLSTATARYANLPVDFQLTGADPYKGTLRGFIERLTCRKPGSPDSHRSAARPAQGSEQHKKLVNAALYVLPRLYSLTDLDFEHFSRMFQKYGRSHGATSFEIENAVALIVGKLLTPTLHGMPLTSALLKQALTNHDNAIALVPEELGDPCLAHWSNWTNDAYTRDNWIVERSRRHFDDAMRSDVRTIVITGEGGCGKTSFLAQAMRPIIEVVRDSASFDGFVALSWTHDIADNWVDGIVGEWSNRPSISDAIRRLRTAHSVSREQLPNPNGKAGKDTILWIGVDGLDEKSPPDTFYALLREIEASDDIGLILTCRAHDADEVLSTYFRRSKFGLPLPSGQSKYVEVRLGPFVGDELPLAVEAILGREVRERLNPSTRGATRLPTGIDAPRPISSAIQDSLAHPRMLTAFGLLREREPDQLAAALDGGASSLRKVAVFYIRQVVTKYRDRHRERGLPTPREFCWALKRVASRTTSGDRFTMDDWINGVTAGSNITQYTAELLLDEASSGGLVLIDQSSDTWHWRHFFVQDALTVETYTEFFR